MSHCIQYSGATDTYNLDLICLKAKLNARKLCKECKGDEELLKTVKERFEILKKNKKIVKALLKLPKVEQKSQEWYLMRQNLITASDFAQALGQGKFGSQNDIIKKKVRPSDESSASFSNPCFKWGNMFEQVANDIYCKLHHDIVVHEFGLLPHKTLSFFGASPDGISETGIMLEIKCPYKRKVVSGGEVPKQYYYQIQGQLEVCGLDECDYFECQFQQFSNLQEMYNAYGDNRIKGVIIECPLADGNGTYYKYSPIIMGVSTPDVPLDDFKSWVDQNTEMEFVDIKLWYLDQYNLQRVTFDKRFTGANLLELKKVWERIVLYRDNPERYNIEILKTIDIGDTPRFKPLPEKTNVKFTERKTSVTGYSFITDPSE
jgi:putative phage-type endonuclease